MVEVYCPKCGRGYVEKIDKDKKVEEIIGYDIGYTFEVYKCNDCGYEFINGVKYNE